MSRDPIQRLDDIVAAMEAIREHLTRNEIAGMRDRLAHRYFDTSRAILQGTVTNDLPELEVAVARLRERLTE